MQPSDPGGTSAGAADTERSGSGGGDGTRDRVQPTAEQLKARIRERASPVAEQVQQTAARVADRAARRRARRAPGVEFGCTQRPRRAHFFYRGGCAPPWQADGGADMDGAILRPEDDEPLHPAVVRALRRYATADERDRDAVVAEVLGAWNAALRAAGGRAAAGGEQAAVLVVDADPGVRRVVARLLASEGYEVLVARDGAEALAAMRRRRPRLILLDPRLPRLDGRGFRARLRAEAELAEIPVVVLSARPDEAAAGLGAAAVLPKPFEPEALLGAVRRLAGPSAA